LKGAAAKVAAPFCLLDVAPLKIISHRTVRGSAGSISPVHIPQRPFTAATAIGSVVSDRGKIASPGKFFTCTFVKWLLNDEGEENP